MPNAWVRGCRTWTGCLSVLRLALSGDAVSRIERRAGCAGHPGGELVDSEVGDFRIAAQVSASTTADEDWDWPSRVLVPHAAVEDAVGLLLVHAAPLLEEERHRLSDALVAERERPLGLHRPRAGSGFAADNGPVDVCQVKTSCVREQGLE